MSLCRSLCRVLRLPHGLHPRVAASMLLLPMLLLLAGQAASAAGACSSDGRPTPPVVVERFISDTCAACWQRTVPAADRAAFAVDWIVAGADADAPLAAAALPEAAVRLASLGYAGNGPPPQFWKWRHAVSASRSGMLRVAHGPAVNDYVGVSISWAPRGADTGPLGAWLLLVEELPAGTAGSPVVRRLVRAALQVERITPGRTGWSERRSMRLPPGTDSEHLRVAGLLADPRGLTVAAAVSACAH